MSTTAKETEWAELLILAPGLRDFELAAEQAGRNGAWWWPRWVESFGPFVALTRGVDAQQPQAHATIVAHLFSVFRAHRPSENVNKK